MVAERRYPSGQFDGDFNSGDGYTWTSSPLPTGEVVDLLPGRLGADVGPGQG